MSPRGVIIELFLNEIIHIERKNTQFASEELR